MSLVLNTVSAIQLCAGCTVAFEPMDTLGAAEDPAGVGSLAEVLHLGDRGYLASSGILGGVVIVYDSQGRYQRELTREGEGPGELLAPPHFASGPGGILMLEPGTTRLHLFSPDLDFIRTFQVPGARGVGPVQPDPATDGWLVGYHGEDYKPGILLLDQQGNVVRSMQLGEEAANLRGWQTVIRGTDGMIWTASPVGLVELLDEDLKPLGSIQLELPGMEGWEAPRQGPVGWPAQGNEIRLAPDGSGAWVFAIAPERRFAESTVDELREMSMARRSALEQIVDAYVYWVRLEPNGLALVGTDNFDTLVRPLGDGDLAFDLADTPDGNRRIRVGRIRFTKGSG